ncbi:hypothetical protein CVT26_007331 [Gymnopilus dilepis]|uniref:Uncharacterized protein n=1 Tax=Gymnopilus dilepis TaxID=231916 RepID=A0A409W1J0_9AGAR|nr:hypothetical protein CVT26_007331 [Gymnopilus dilepis]
MIAAISGVPSSDLQCTPASTTTPASSASSLYWTSSHGSVIRRAMHSSSKVVERKSGGSSRSIFSEDSPMSWDLALTETDGMDLWKNLVLLDFAELGRCFWDSAFFKCVPHRS